MIGDMAPGQTMNTEDEADGMIVLNSMLDSWNTERLAVRSIQRSEYTLALAPASQPHTIGASGTFVATRPSRIEYAGYMDAGSDREWPVTVIDARQYAEIVDKDAEGIPCNLYNDGAIPNSSLYLYPKPPAGGTLVLYTWQRLADMAITDTIVLPEGYTDAIRYNLAVRMSMEWGRPLRDANVLELARETKGNLKAHNNVVHPVLKCDPALLGTGRFDILRGSY